MKIKIHTELCTYKKKKKTMTRQDTRLKKTFNTLNLIKYRYRQIEQLLH